MRRKILKMAFIFLGCYSMGKCVQASVFDVWTSSYTSTGEILAVLSTVPSVLYSVCIDSSASPAGAGAAFSVYNATATQSGVAFTTTTIIDTTRSQTGCYTYNTYLSSGIAYTNSGTTPAKVNILWNRWSH